MKTSILALAAFAALAAPAHAGTAEMSDAEWKANWASLNDAMRHGEVIKLDPDCTRIRAADPLKDSIFCQTVYVWAAYTYVLLKHRA
jgi:hypothetical protein